MGLLTGILFITLASIRSKNTGVFYQYQHWPDRTWRTHNIHNFYNISEKEDHCTDEIFIRFLQA
jgi:hypothetical protein